MQRMTRFVGPNRNAPDRRPPTLEEIGQLRRLWTFIRPYRRKQGGKLHVQICPDFPEFFLIDII